MGKLTTTFDDAELLTHEVSVSDSQGVALGTVLDCECPPRRFWSLRRRTDAILSAKTVTGSTLEVVIGHATFCSLLARPSTTCFHPVYEYVQSVGYCPSVLCDSVRDEFQAFQGLMVLQVAVWDRGWLPMAPASDASEWVYGVTAMAARSSEIARVGRMAERSRFRHKCDFGSIR